MKKLLVILIAFVFLFSPLLLSGLNKDEYEYTLTVEHLFTHCLIAYPNIAFAKDNPMRQNYNMDCITKDEFARILNSLYENDYCLVDINDTFENQNGVIVKKAVKVPKGKKALILSFDDVNYDHKKMGLGMVDKIILDENGKFATTTQIQDNEDISYSNEFIPMLENFVEKHPNFSPFNDMGTINITGYDGILGYRTQSKNKVNRQEEIEKVKPIVKKLKQNGWNFASHSYGHYHMNKLTDEQFLEEVNLWKEEVEPLVGKTKVYVYPYGEWQVFDKYGNISNKHQYLLDAGFELFCGVGMRTFYDYLPNKHNKVLFMDRKVVDGNTLRKKDACLYPFFDPEFVYDYKSRPSV
mgnify:FL=1